ncbi:LysR family transcriptional regulator [Maritimibacter sp. DP07]|uniref:LysR family transcriptional regulator n=1 Tax=Maritimibacter harenae TaxID=2606218 RepID=A0A845LY35_9RHOB|nr:LysR family transcriptional regulator [Maritimibacter harenae]MZR11689.1 LysR family transcriptional regulator [Maritimibacter harenae]
MKTTLRQLEIFVGAVEHGSFRACAQAMGLSQVVVSEHIRAMEDRLGVLLFERRAGSRPVLTEAGREAFVRGRSLLGEYHDFESTFSEGPERLLRVIAPPFLLRGAANAIEDLRARHPDRTLMIDTANHTISGLIEQVESRQADMAFFYGARPVDHPLLERIATEPLAIFVGQSHPLAAPGIVRPQDLVQTPAIHLTQEHPLRREIDIALIEIGVAPGPIALETDEFGLILSSASRNTGFVCMFEATVSETGQTAGLRQIALSPPVPALGVYVVWREATRRRALLRELVEILRS